MYSFHTIRILFDQKVISIARKVHVGLTRASLFFIFFWFGALKVIDTSPAQPLVLDLLRHTLPFVDPQTFLIGFGIFEMTIGLLFLFQSFERIVFSALAVHLIMTFMPLVLLPDVTWIKPFVPTLEGQYILKNVVIVALATCMIARLHPKNLPIKLPVQQRLKHRKIEKKPLNQTRS
ncbi:hypothetical protein IT408_02670 [Candidatus Uhrbacteria bacterium]|nr:hypothetical protein [Candidatus Uhrbacteria bacterium]